jgi:putative cardiolipin synthase
MLSTRTIANFLLLTSCLYLTACASLPKNVERKPSYAWNQPEKTRLGRLVASQARQHPQQSGFALIASGRSAFNDRIAMTELAEKSLDLQYYIWEEDKTGRILAERLLKAADRGVHIRILLDDNNMAKRDNSIALLDAHPNIEIRMANPFPNRNSHIWSFITDLGRVNHRMHNKSMGADGAISIIGGRNIGDDYFEVSDEANFRDMDLLVAGPLVKDVGQSFDYLWNGSWSYPISALAKREFSAEDLKRVRLSLADAEQEDPYPHPLDKEVNTITRNLNQALQGLVWAKGTVIDNDPVRLANSQKGEISQAFNAKLKTLNKELLIESAYFVGTKAGIEEAKRLVKKGVRVRVLTNSLASNDVLAAHAGYAKWRKGLLKAGVELYELRPDSKGRLLDKLLVKGESKAALHTKAFAFDKKSIFVGSFNLDPRSANINTEIGIYIESPELARRLEAFMDTGVTPEVAWKVVLNEDDQLRWIDKEKGKTQAYDVEPMTSVWQRLVAGIIRILPIESQL